MSDVIEFPGADKRSVPKNVTERLIENHEKAKNQLKTEAHNESQIEKDFAEYMQNAEIKYNYDNNTFILGKQELDLIQLSQVLGVRVAKVPGLDKKEVSWVNLLNLWRIEEKKRVWEQVRQSLPKYDPARGDAAIQAWVQHVCRETDKGKEYTHIMVKQWFWQVKRALHNRARYDHVMLVLQGAQGTGKSLSIAGIRQLLSPLWCQTTLRDMGDERTFAKFQDNVVGCVPELAGGYSTSIERLKDLITNDRVEQRIMKSLDNVSKEQNCSFIGDTNKRLVDVIKDDENRRFWEIRFKPADRISIDFLLNFNYAAMWSSVCESDDTSPLRASGLHQKILATQHEELTTRTPFQEWVLHCELDRGDHPSSSSQLYKVFVDFCKAEELEPCSSREFGAAIKRHGLTRKTFHGKHRKITKNSKVYFTNIPT